MKKSLFVSGLVCLSIMGSAFAMQGATTTNQLSAGDREIVLEQGFSVQKVLQIAKQSNPAITVGVQQTQSGQVAFIELEGGARFILMEDACVNNVCYGLTMLTYFPLQGVSAGQFDINDFNLKSSGGSISYFEKGNRFVSQRTVTNFGGITRGSLIGELDYYIGYNNYFVKWLKESSRLVSVSDVEEAAPTSKIDNVITSKAQPTARGRVAEISDALLELDGFSYDYK